MQPRIIQLIVIIAFCIEFNQTMYLKSNFMSHISMSMIAHCCKRMRYEHFIATRLRIHKYIYQSFNSCVIKKKIFFQERYTLCILL